jgi:hypothetical protein
MRDALAALYDYALGLLAFALGFRPWPRGW